MSLEDKIFEINEDPDKSDLDEIILSTYHESLKDWWTDEEVSEMENLFAQKEQEDAFILASTKWSLEQLWIESNIRPVARQERLSYDTDWNRMEPEWGFQDINGDNLSWMIDELWLSSNILILCEELFWKPLNEYEASQVALTIRYLLEAETYWWLNKLHDPGYPWSWGYFEYQKNDGERSWEIYDFSTASFRVPNESDTNLRSVKTINWENKEWIRSVWHDSSYDMALRRIPESILAMDSVLKWEYDNIWNPDAQDMTRLNAEQQVMVVLSDIYWDYRWPRLFDRVIRWDNTAISELYAHIHHADLTNSETAELKARLNIDLLWYPEISPVSRPDDFWEILIAWES